MATRSTPSRSAQRRQRREATQKARADEISRCNRDARDQGDYLCPVCGRVVEQPTGRGRPREYHYECRMLIVRLDQAAELFRLVRFNQDCPAFHGELVSKLQSTINPLRTPRAAKWAKQSESRSYLERKR